MKTQELVTPLGSLEIENSDGERLSDFTFDAPYDVLATIHKAQNRGQCCGSVYSDGKRWDWRERQTDTTVIEITSREAVVLSVEIPTAGWRAFRLVAARAGYEPSQYLAVVVAGAMIDWNMTVDQAINWLFCGKEEGYAN